jgi:hypothetical protein
MEQTGAKLFLTLKIKTILFCLFFVFSMKVRRSKDNIFIACELQYYNGFVWHLVDELIYQMNFRLSRRVRKSANLAYQVIGGISD